MAFSQMACQHSSVALPSTRTVIRGSRKTGCWSPISLRRISHSTLPGRGAFGVRQIGFDFQGRRQLQLHAVCLEGRTGASLPACVAHAGANPGNKAPAGSASGCACPEARRAAGFRLELRTNWAADSRLSISVPCIQCEVLHARLTLCRAGGRSMRARSERGSAQRKT